MVQKIDPFIGLNYGWDNGENGWGEGMNENLLQLGFFNNANIDDIVDTLPSSPSNGEAYFLTSDNRVYYRAEGDWYNAIVPENFDLFIKSTGNRYTFSNSSLKYNSVDLSVNIVSDIPSYSLSIGTKITTKGCISVGDGGHGIFIVEAASGTPDGYSRILLSNGNNAVLQTNNGSVTPEQFGADKNGIINSSAAIQRAFDFPLSNCCIFRSRYRCDAPVYIRRNDYSVYGFGWGTGLTSAVGDFGDALVVEPIDLDVASIFRVTLQGFEINRTVETTTGSLLRVTEAAYCNFKNLSLQEGFIGASLQGLRACYVDDVHIRSGRLFSSELVGSRFLVVEDSPSILSYAETTELFINNLNATTNGASNVEYGIEIKECDGVWFDSGHVRGAKKANAFVNGSATDQLLGVKFDNFWFDGATDKCFLVAGTPSGYMGFVECNDCSFTGASVNAVHIQAGTVLDWIRFNNCSTWSTAGQISWRLDAGKNISINELEMKAVDTANIAGSSAIVVGAAVETVRINGGKIFNSSNLDNGISINDGVISASVHNFEFRGLGASVKPVNIQNPFTLDYSSSGCSTDQAGGYVAGNMQSGKATTADDAVAVFYIGTMSMATINVGVTFNVNFSGTIAIENITPSNSLKLSGGANVVATTGVLTGTTGSDGNLTVSVTDDGNLYIENRTGSVRDIYWKIIDRNI